MLARGYRFKLRPTAEQEALFRQFAGVCRLVYNLALEQRRDWWRHYERETGQRLNHVAQARQLTDLRAELTGSGPSTFPASSRPFATWTAPSGTSSQDAPATRPRAKRASATPSASPVAKLRPAA